MRILKYRLAESKKVRPMVLDPLVSPEILFLARSTAATIFEQSPVLDISTVFQPL
jgi:hypothetical protein